MAAGPISTQKLRRLEPKTAPRPLSAEEIARGDRWLNVFEADGKHLASTIVEGGPKLPESYRYKGETAGGSQHFISEQTGYHYFVSLHYHDRR
jgi:hypothetical protein